MRRARGAPPAIAALFVPAVSSCIVLAGVDGSADTGASAGCASDGELEAVDPLALRGPEQDQPWRPAPGLDADSVLAIERGFALGLPDPRRLEHRRVTIEHPGLRDPAIETPGWLLPGGRGASRFALAWDGLVYRVLEIGEPVAAADDGCLARADERPRLCPSDARPEMIAARLGLEPRGALRAFEVEDASAMWVDMWMLEASLTHQSGDDELTGALLAVLGRSPDRTALFADSHWFEVAQLELLLADNARRAVVTDRPREGLAGAVAALDEIARAADVDAAVDVFRGFGETGIEALIETVAHDDRMTRLAADWIGTREPMELPCWVPPRAGRIARRSILRVAEAAQAILERLVGWQWMRPVADPHDRAALAAEIRESVRWLNGRSGPAAWAAILASDDATVDDVTHAARRLVRPVGAAARGHGAFPPAAPWPMEGDASGAVDRAAVSRDLLRRALATRAETSAHCTLLGALALWDGDAPAEPFAALVLRSIVALDEDFPGRVDLAGVASRCIDMAVVASAARGADDVVARWVDAVLVLVAEPRHASDADWGGPLDALPDHPELRRLARELFRPDAPYATELARGEATIDADRLRLVPEYAALVRSMLERRGLSELVVRTEAGVSFAHPFAVDGWLVGPDQRLGETGLHDGVSRLRVCDLVAWDLVGALDADIELELGSPEAERDAAIEAMIAVLDTPAR